jgi:hypothetical protein
MTTKVRHHKHACSLSVILTAMAVMIRAAADRAFLPAKSLFEPVGDMMILNAKTVVSPVRPP